MDLLPMRVQNIFNQMFKPDPIELNPANMPMQDQNQVPNINLLQELLTPRTDTQNQLKTMMESQPKREDFKPSLFQNIMARLSGLSESGAAGQANGQMIGYKGMGTAGNRLIHENLNRPYTEAMSDWGAKLKPLGEIADLERADNTNRRMIASTMISDQNKDADRETKESIAADRTAVQRENIAQKDRFLAYKYFAQAHPDHKIQQDAQGYLIAIDPQNPTNFIYIQDDKGNKVKGARLPDVEKIKQETSAALTQIAARADAAKDLEGTRHINDLGEIEARTEGGIKRDAAKPASASGSKPKVDDKKVFPNGKVGRWDGQGWVDTGEVAKKK
jgi:hypothetical protein